jgi:hypothetical protein
MELEPRTTATDPRIGRRSERSIARRRLRRVTLIVLLALESVGMRGER